MAFMSSLLPRPRPVWPGVLATCVGSVATAHAALINEFSASTTGTDTEYVELFAEPGSDLSGLSILAIEGDANGPPGIVDQVIVPGGFTDDDGLLLVELNANVLENGSQTLLLVEGFTGSEGQDLDTDDDGVLDATPWSALLDGVAVLDGGSGDRTYAVTLEGNYDGVSDFPPGGASRIPDGTDTDSTDDWVRNDFDLAGIAGFAGSPEPGEAFNTPGAPNARVGDDTGGDTGGGQCGDAAVAIHAIQGTGETFDPAFGAQQTVEGVVTAVHPGLGGFYVQEEPGDEDLDPATSEGIFVYVDAEPTVVPGELVRVSGTVAEYRTGGSSQTQLTGSPSVQPCGTAVIPEPAEVVFPLAAPDDLEALEGMLVTLVQPLVISEYFNFDRFGEVVVSLPPEGWDRLYTPTAVVEPGAAANALAAEYERRRIVIDDARSTQNPDPAVHPGNGEEFTLGNRFRGGDIVTGITGVIDETFGSYRVQPTLYGSYEAVNERPASPEPVGGNVTVASLNVLNYFLSLDDGPDDCGPELSLECRGADESVELERQRAKLVAALVGLDADVIGLIELENTTGVMPVADLVAGVNAVVGAGVYDYIDTGVIGTDAIRVGMIYRPASVTPVGGFAVLDASVDPRFRDDRNRPALAQTFEANGQRFTVTVNHFKSKGSACDEVGDPDTGDGQGNCNLTRTLAATALADWLASDPTGSGSDAALVIGDLNAYDEEDPIDALREAGYVDLIAAYQGELAYSYVFDGQFGYLDHALANAALFPYVTGATVWHINADEPDILDYDVSFKQDAQDALYAPDAYRSSDHDPVLVGLRFELPVPSLAADCREGGWRSLYRGDGSTFRNQGLCIRYVNTGR